jgi:YbbR domain-containing protein
MGSRLLKKLRRLLLTNGWYKLTAVLLSLFLWYLVQGEEVLEVDRKLQIKVELSEGYIVKGESIRYKDATIRGSRVVLNELLPTQLEARLRIPAEAKGILKYRIGREMFPKLDPRLKITIHDAYLELHVDEKIDRRVPVKEFLIGTPAEGFIIEKTIIKPRLVEVAGLRSEVNRVQRIMTEPIDISGLKESTVFEVQLVPEILDRSNLSEEKVSVTLEVGEDKINKTFANIPIEVIGTDYVTQIRPQFIAIEVQGTAGVLNFIRKEDLRAFVEMMDAQPGRYEKNIQVQIPAKTVLIETRPKTAMVTVQGIKKQIRP